MQTHTQNTGKHRWAVAAPLFLLFLALSVREGAMTSVQADVLVQTGATLSAGTRLVSAKGLSHLRVGDMDLQGWNGGFQATKNGDTITIAALSTPVLVKQGEREMIVPAFMQWKGKELASLKEGMAQWISSRDVRSLPDTFSRDALHELDVLASEQISEDVSTDPFTLLPLQLGQELRLPSARERSESLMRLERIQALQTALQADPSSVDALLATPDMPAILASDEGMNILPTLLSQAVSVGKGDLFLSAFASTPDRFLLSAFHPLIRDHVRVLPQRTDLSDDERFTLLLFTPLSDTAPQGLSDIALSQWQSQWAEVVLSRTGVMQFAASLPLLRDQIERLDTLQYPKRVDTYISAILAIADSVHLQLMPDAKHILDGLQALRDTRRLAAPIADIPSSASSDSSASSSSIAALSSVAPAELVEQADRQLQQAGFMTINNTQLQPIGNAVHVSHIVFGAPKRDITLDFVFDPVANQVSAISFQGKTLPNSVTLKQMIDWLRRK